MLVLHPGYSGTHLIQQAYTDCFLGPGVESPGIQTLVPALGNHLVRGQGRLT